MSLIKALAKVTQNIPQSNPLNCCGISNLVLILSLHPGVEDSTEREGSKSGFSRARIHIKEFDCFCVKNKACYPVSTNFIAHDTFTGSSILTDPV